MPRLDLEPGAAAPARLVGRVERLQHEALVTRTERDRERGLGAGRVVHERPRHAQRRRDVRGERRDALARRMVDQVLAVEVQAVEQAQRERARAACGAPRGWQ